MSRETALREEARLILLKGLAEETDGTLNSNLLVREIRRFGIKRERPWVHGELDYLAQMGAVVLRQEGSVKIATITRLGRRHVDREVEIEGVTRPSEPEA